MKLSETKTMSNFKLLQVSESGHGKTWRSLSATRFGPVLVIDVDNKLTAMRDRIPADAQELIHVEVPRSAKDVQQIVDGLVSRNPYSTVVLDTWSRWHDLAIEGHKALNPKQTAMELRDWGAIKQANKAFLFKLLSLNCNVIVNTHVGKEKDSADRQVLTVGTTGTFGTEMPQYFNETHYLYFDSKFKVKGNRSNSIVANTSRPESMLSPNGDFTVNDLSIFDSIAFKVK
jgi:hypothetical protein